MNQKPHPPQTQYPNPDPARVLDPNAPWVAFTKSGKIFFDVPLALQYMGLPNTDDNAERIIRTIRKIMRSALPHIRCYQLAHPTATPEEIL